MQKLTLVKSGGTMAAAAALALGGTALANADQTPTPTSPPGSIATPTPGRPATTGGDHAADRAAHEALLLSGVTAVKVTQAATAKEPTAKLEHVGTGPAGGYSARMVRTDGTPIVLHIDANFSVTSDETAPTRAPGGPHGKGHPQAPSQLGQPGKATRAPSGTPTS